MRFPRIAARYGKRAANYPAVPRLAAIRLCLAYANNPRKMGAACAGAAGLGLPLAFKARYPNGKRHRRCG